MTLPSGHIYEEGRIDSSLLGAGRENLNEIKTKQQQPHTPDDDEAIERMLWTQ